MDNIKLLKKYVDDTETFNELFNIPWKIFYDKKKRIDETLVENVNVLILNNPCMGFGDIVFAMKLKRYIIDWYNCNITIASTQPDGFIQMGEDKNNLLLLKSEGERSQCRRFKLLKLHKLNGNKYTKKTVFDIIFVAPLPSDFDIDYKDVKHIIPYSTRLNTFFFSEYNDSLSKPADFQTGIGEDRHGIFLTKILKNTKLPQLKNRYAVVYIAESINNADGCFLSFMEMVCKKYNSHYKKFDIVVPGWIADNIDEYRDRIVKNLGKYYGNIVSFLKDGPPVYLKEGDKKSGVLSIRGNIFPLQNQDMLRLIKYSVRDILLTGDQSITDALSCCSAQKNIFYQIAPWKVDFSKNLAKELPNKYINKVKTSCGTIRAIEYHSDYKKFMKDWDFRRIARRKMDSIFNAALNRIDSETIQEFEELILQSRTLNSFVKRFDKLIN